MYISLVLSFSNNLHFEICGDNFLYLLSLSVNVPVHCQRDFCEVICRSLRDSVSLSTLYGTCVPSGWLCLMVTSSVTHYSSNTLAEGHICARKSLIFLFPLIFRFPSTKICRTGVRISGCIFR